MGWANAGLEPVQGLVGGANPGTAKNTDTCFGTCFAKGKQKKTKQKLGQWLVGKVGSDKVCLLFHCETR